MNWYERQDHEQRRLMEIPQSVRDLARTDPIVHYFVTAYVHHDCFESAGELMLALVFALARDRDSVRAAYENYVLTTPPRTGFFKG